MRKALLILNAGSSSIKFAIYEYEQLSLLCRGQIASISSNSCFTAEINNSNTITQTINALNHQQAIDHLINWVTQSKEGWELIGIGHRVVHGGVEFSKPTRVNRDVIKSLHKLEALAPLHQPHNLAGINSIYNLYPDLPQIACFDTAFHATQDEVQSIIPLPIKYRKKGLMRYGFHGLSYEYLIEELGRIDNKLAASKVIIAHLGQGASLCAIQNSKSCGSTMGFSTLDGLLMGTRCGSIDPGALLYLLQNEGLTPDELSRCLYEESGLLALSCLSSDMQTLQKDTSEETQLALNYYVNSVVKNIASLASMMEGLDAVVFSGGIGENSSFIREAVLTKLAWFGIEFDDKANDQHQIKISTENSKISAFVIKTNEELMIAKHTKQHLQ